MQKKTKILLAVGSAMAAAAVGIAALVHKTGIYIVNIEELNEDDFDDDNYDQGDKDDDDIRYCTCCGKEVNDSDNYCKHCGEIIE